MVAAVCLSECTSLSVLKHLTDTSIHLPRWISVRPSGLFMRTQYSVQLVFSWPTSFPSPQLCDQSFSIVCLSVVSASALLEYGTWTCKRWVICTWQITELTRDGLGGCSVNFCDPWGLMLGEQLHWASSSPARSVYCLCTWKELGEWWGRKGGRLPSGGKQPVMVTGLGRQRCHQAWDCVGSSAWGLGNGGGDVLCPLLLNPESAALIGQPALSDLGAVDTHYQCTLTSEELSWQILVWSCLEPEGALKITLKRVKQKFQKPCFIWGFTVNTCLII